MQTSRDICISVEPIYKYYIDILETKMAVRIGYSNTIMISMTCMGFQGNGSHLNLKGLPTNVTPAREKCNKTAGISHSDTLLV